MKHRILNYRRRIDDFLAQEQDEGASPDRIDWLELRQEHLAQIVFFQHERLIHLLVTMLFAVIELFSVGLVLFAGEPAVGLLCLAVLALLIPYILHYYLLENEVQKLYDQYDRIEEHCHN